VSREGAGQSGSVVGGWGGHSKLPSLLPGARPWSTLLFEEGYANHINSYVENSVFYLFFNDHGVRWK
jgi:hypothetical protein